MDKWKGSGLLKDISRDSWIVKEAREQRFRRVFVTGWEEDYAGCLH